MKSPPKRIVLLASGSGSNVENIATYFKDSTSVIVSAVYCNNPAAGVLDRCKRLGIPAITFNRPAYREPDMLPALLRQHRPDLIVLAGFLWKVPEAWIRAFPVRIINIHPALLPLYGGKGMYGMHVHEAVCAAGDRESGITIHYVNEEYDQGAIIEQIRVDIPEGTDAKGIASRIHQLEMEHFPRVIESLLHEKR